MKRTNNGPSGGIDAKASGHMTTAQRLATQAPAKNPQPASRKAAPVFAPGASVQRKSSAPPAYRPQTAAAKVQRKSLAPPVYRPNLGSGSSISPKKSSPAAPPVYRPQGPEGKVQRKSAAPPVYHPGAAGGSAVELQKGRPAAPPVYRPQTKAKVQLKTLAPPVYRPNMGSGSPIHPKKSGPAAPPAYRPQRSEGMVQRKSLAPPVYRPGNTLPLHPKMAATVKQPAGQQSSAALQSRLPTRQEAAAGARLLGFAPPHRVRAPHPIVQGGRVQASFGSKRPTPLLDELNQKDFTYRTKSDPQVLADQLADASPKFQELRQRANVSVQEVYQKDLDYLNKPKKGSGVNPAYYKEGSAYFDLKNNHPAMQITNIIFETANAAQSQQFQLVESDYISGAISNKSLDAYGVKASDLSEELREEYRTGTKAARRSLIQEYYEWISLQIAGDSFAELRTKVEKGTVAEDYANHWANLSAHDTFMAYYKSDGKAHRASVQKAIEEAELQHV